jgi:hypothetical protein
LENACISPRCMVYYVLEFVKKMTSTMKWQNIAFSERRV